MVTEKELIERFWKTNWWKYLNHSQVVELTDYINSKPQPQQKEQFSKEETCEFAEYCDKVWNNFDPNKYAHLRDLTTYQLLDEYFNSKTPLI